MTGSQIAKGGFNNEQEVADKFNNWKNDVDAQKWLEIMMYNLDEIESVRAVKFGGRGYKSDVFIRIEIAKKLRENEPEPLENIQVKLVSGDKGFNQVEKKKVEGYLKLWHIDSEIEQLLKLYDGELPAREGSRDSRRMFVDEFSAEEQEKLKNFFQKNIIMIISDIIRGRGRFAAEWTLVINKNDDYKWCLMAVNEAISIYAGDCQVKFTDKGNIRLGNITLQRKGGDNGADSANMLQFKADPMMLFGI
ncbi:MAG: hypothetical protein J6V90_02620 [Treponema sp.]|nr:hypothetical protein [Treponema sp.]